MSNDPFFLQIENDIKNNHVVLYMKGTKDHPKCGFSAKVVNIFKTLNIDFKDIDVLQDLALRDKIKQYSNWPTLPQIYINQEFIGGCDIVTEMYQSGELQSLLTHAK